MGRGRAFALVSLRSAVSAARQAYVVHPWDRACIGCHVSTATLHAECHVAHCMAYYMATATDVWRLPRGMSFGDCHVAYYMATATWHDAWQLPRGMTYGECFMVQPSSCSAAVRFWRGLVAQFPQLIDYLCTGEDLKQVRDHTTGPVPHSLTSAAAVRARVITGACVQPRMCPCACICEGLCVCAALACAPAQLRVACLRRDMRLRKPPLRSCLVVHR